MISIPIAFGVISAINGLVIRVALICSNVVLVPIMTVLELLGVNQLNQQRVVIYHSMGVIGAHLAHLDSQNKSKLVFTIAVFACMILTYFI